ncbi:regucalcin [Penicillium frequentans]|uniref:Regucalcin n=1 Tax=Penicillium frequentans TaxID=3151616 RepID=A0AAD6CLZ4_9EURO|nr:regucalcin [Penicillium glabrum]
MKITALDFDLGTGSISNPRTLIDFQGAGGEPDGMVLDADGNLWVAVYGTSHIMVFTPQGKLLKQIALPAMYPTCPTWGGKNQEILYITTAKDRTDTPDPNDEGIWEDSEILPGGLTRTDVEYSRSAGMESLKRVLQNHPATGSGNRRASYSNIPVDPQIDYLFHMK